jgi:hypothetical protein
MGRCTANFAIQVYYSGWDYSFYWGDYGQANNRAVGSVLGYVIETPEPSLVLLLGIGFGIVSVIGWRWKK